ncbi:MAG: pyrophosphate--fructose-6-phosphate 1-phosphotransferase [Crocinitomicaceae bacterium]|nr:pyrophosphate--fructose-6-phosphate 1-phosphotransferase [Crocinitomicaceae bacterium]
MKVAFLTAGGIAPCLSSSLGHFIKTYHEKCPAIELIAYKNGYKGLLLGDFISIDDEIRKNASKLYAFGGSPIGNSRVKLTNVKDCIKKGYINEGQVPLEVAAKQLVKDKITILHTIGGDDTNTTAADLVSYLSENNYELTVVGLPKTIDNDVYPISQTLGASTAAEQSALFFNNVVNENTTSSRQFVIHEVMGRNCGWLTAKSAAIYRHMLQKKEFLPEILVNQKRWDIHAVFVPEMEINMEVEMSRLRKIMDKQDCVNIFLSEGAGLDSIISDMEKNGEKINRDAFGHVRLDEINPGKWFAEKFANAIGAEKVLVQKSGYFARSAASNNEDLDLIFKSVEFAVDSALQQNSGVAGLDDNLNSTMSCIDFKRIKGGKPFDVKESWFVDLLSDIGQY